MLYIRFFGKGFIKIASIGGNLRPIIYIHVIIIHHYDPKYLS